LSEPRSKVDVIAFSNDVFSLLWVSYPVPNILGSTKLENPIAITMGARIRRPRFFHLGNERLLAEVLFFQMRMARQTRADRRHAPQAARVRVARRNEAFKVRARAQAKRRAECEALMISAAIRGIVAIVNAAAKFR
jgi:hypothetical protein